MEPTERRTGLLSKKQRDELHRAVVQYLLESGMKESAAQVARESGVEATGDASSAGLLEKKWTSVLRLQKKVLELEARVQSLESELDGVGGGGGGGGGGGAGGGAAGGGGAGVGGGGTGGRRRETVTGDGLPRGPSRHVLAGHRSPVTSVCFHPQFTQVASASEDATVKLWDAESGEFERTLKGHTNAVQSVAYEPTNGTLLASCSADLTIKLWDTTKYECVKTLHGHDHNVSAVCFVPEGDRLISASRDKTLKVWETVTGYCVRTLRAHEDWVRAVRVRGTVLISAGGDQTVRLWDLQRGECTHVLRDHGHVVECLAVSAPAATPLLASGGRDKVVRVWDPATAACVHTLSGHDNWVRGVVFAPSGTHLISVGDDRSVRVWDLRNDARCLRTIADAHSHFISCVDFHRRLPAVATGGVDDVVKIFSCR